jgi:hypothetical protein
MGYGIGGHLAISKQNSVGTATSNWVYIPFVSESLTENIEQLQSESLKAIYDNPNMLEGINNVTGDIVFEPHPIYLGHFLNACIGNATSTLQTSAYQHEFLPRQDDFDANFALQPYTVAVFKNVGSSYQYTDAMIHTLAIEITAGGIINATATVHARTSSLQNPTTPSFISADPFTWNETSLQVAGSASDAFESATITIDNPIEGIATLNGAKVHSRVKRTGFRTINVAGDQDFSSQAEYNAFRAQTRQRFQFTITGDNISAGGAESNEITFDIPQCNYTTYASPVGGPGRITASYEGNGEYDVSSSYSLRATLTNTSASY